MWRWLRPRDTSGHGRPRDERRRPNMVQRMENFPVVVDDLKIG